VSSFPAEHGAHSRSFNAAAPGRRHRPRHTVAARAARFRRQDPAMAAPIYRDWDQAQLDAQMNLRARWPEHPQVFARWAEDSRAVRAGTRALTDLAYGESPGERLDLFPVPGAARAPLVAFIHGGYWQALDKGDFSYPAPALLARGVAYASLNYDLAPKAPIGRMVAQVRRAVAWLHANAAAHGIDPDRIVLAGHSAGGHLALTALDRSWPAEHGLPGDVVKGALSISGVYDLEPVRLSYHNAVLGLDRADAQALSPLRRIPRDAGPALLSVGGEETDEFRWQQDALEAAWRDAGLRVATVGLPGRGHFDAMDAISEPGHPMLEALVRLADQGELR
jgi:arylformamidase